MLLDFRLLELLLIRFRILLLTESLLYIYWLNLSELSIKLSLMTFVLKVILKINVGIFVFWLNKWLVHNLTKFVILLYTFLFASESYYPAFFSRLYWVLWQKGGTDKIFKMKWNYKMFIHRPYKQYTSTMWALFMWMIPIYNFKTKRQSLIIP